MTNIFTLENIISFIFIYFIVWWLVLFCVLPFGIQREEDVESGNDSGAPRSANLRKKFYLTSMIALVVTIIVSTLAEKLL